MENLTMTVSLMGATTFAIGKHDGQYRLCEDEGRQIPYVTHPIRVSKMLIDVGITDEATLVAAILHDTLEDTKTSYQELLNQFGKEVADLVSELTDDKSLSKGARKALQIEHAPKLSLKAARIKLADKADNIRSLVEEKPPWGGERMLAYADHAEEVVAGMVSPHPKLKAPFERMVSELRASVG